MNRKVALFNATLLNAILPEPGFWLVVLVVVYLNSKAAPPNDPSAPLGPWGPVGPVLP
jgi:hypothetical protein